ncbi:hypothetical protein XIS1_490028 [Xenorhabdus innexi]|uniref:Uncharacterized protein n=1 Tax=Xenorhabdus innexi TaxID=290109 RepID=A0A1N6MYY3_9GAMM|nr:hypothetical protein XIS1_490028 [Xenorhabdus innexi]
MKNYIKCIHIILVNVRALTDHFILSGFQVTFLSAMLLITSGRENSRGYDLKFQ